MRARITPTKRDTDRIAELCWREFCEAQIDSNAVMLIACKRFFNLGKKRMAQLADFFDEIREEFDMYDREDRFRDKIVEELEEVGYDCSEMWNITTTYQDEVNALRMNRKNQTASAAESYKMRHVFNGFRKIVGDGE